MYVHEIELSLSSLKTDVFSAMPSLWPPEASVSHLDLALIKAHLGKILDIYYDFMKWVFSSIKKLRSVLQVPVKIDELLNKKTNKKMAK